MHAYNGYVHRTMATNALRICKLRRRNEDAHCSEHKYAVYASMYTYVMRVCVCVFIQLVIWCVTACFCLWHF